VASDKERKGAFKAGDTVSCWIDNEMDYETIWKYIGSR
jgi:hypothetical protein